jgi:hypothetical protein
MVLLRKEFLVCLFLLIIVRTVSEWVSEKDEFEGISLEDILMGLGRRF